MNLLSELWPEIVNLAVYLVNRTLIRYLEWKSLIFHLYETLDWLKPSLAHLVVLGCCAYVRDLKIVCDCKLDSKVFIEYLVGYDSMNIYHCWVSTKNQIICARDVLFNEMKFYDSRDLQERNLEHAMKVIKFMKIYVLPKPVIP